jgi:hypothetical protein
VLKRREEIDAARTLERHVQRMIEAAYRDRQLMEAAQESAKLEAEGVEGEPWEDVRKRLGLV